MNNPIYVPKGRAKEYGDYALNIYTGCTHRCTYCFVPAVLRKDKEVFHIDVRPRDGILEATQRQLASGGIRDKLIHLCFTCDPYPADVDTTVTREIIKTIKASGNHVQILTKGGDQALRDFDLLDENDWFGVTISGCDEIEPGAAPNHERIEALHSAPCETWISYEPVYNPETVYFGIKYYDFIDLYRIGKLNYHPSDIDWGAFGRECERLCQEYGRNYYIKDDLRKCMEASAK